MPAFPVGSISKSADFYRERLGFTVAYSDESFAKLQRDDSELHLWAANDKSWASRSNLVEGPVCSGAESFIAGTSSCRIEVDRVDELYAELRESSALHYGDSGDGACETDWGTREFAAQDLDGNLLTFFERF